MPQHEHVLAVKPVNSAMHQSHQIQASLLTIILIPSLLNKMDGTKVEQGQGEAGTGGGMEG